MMQVREPPGSERFSSIDCATMLNGLARPEAFQDTCTGHPYSDDKPITIIQTHAFGQGLYNPERTARTYHALCEEASRALSHGRSVLLDASFIRRADRQAVAYEAAAHGANIVFVECVCPREVVLKRLAHRWKARLEGSCSIVGASGVEWGREGPCGCPRASDGRPDLYDAQSAVWETFDADEEPQIQHFVITTTASPAESCEQVLDGLRMPRFACWL